MVQTPEQQRKDLIEAFAPDKRAHELSVRRRRILGNVAGGATLIGAVGLILGTVAANAEKLMLGPDPDELSLEMANIAALRVKAECGVTVEKAPYQFNEDGGVEGQSNFVTAPLAYGQDVCIDGIFDTLAHEVDGCTVAYVKSGWQPVDEDNGHYAVRTDCLPNFLPQK